jgi:hypothetical protein
LTDLLEKLAEWEREAEHNHKWNVARKSADRILELIEIVRNLNKELGDCGGTITAHRLKEAYFKKYIASLEAALGVKEDK